MSSSELVEKKLNEIKLMKLGDSRKFSIYAY